MALKERIQEDMKAAMRAGEKERLATIRMLLAGIKQREVDDRIVLDDAQIVTVIEKMLKQRKESQSQYEAAGREDLASVERYETGVLQAYLPAQLSDAEIDAIIAASVSEAGATGPKDMGKVIGLIRPKVAGRADMGVLSERVKQKLAALS